MINSCTKYALAIQLLFCISISGGAQDSLYSSDKVIDVNSNRKYKNEVGIDISAFSFLLSNASGGYPSFFFRRHSIKNKAIKASTGLYKALFRAYRIRIGSNFSFEKYTPPNIEDEFVNNYYYYFNANNVINSYVFIRIGQEQQKRSGRFELFYGYDLFLDYNKFKEYSISNVSYNLNQPNQYYYNQQWGLTNRTIRTGIAAIAGFKFFLIPRLCFSAEGTFNIGYMSGSKKMFYKNYDSSIDALSVDHQEIRINGFRVNANPIFVVNMGYYFK